MAGLHPAPPPSGTAPPPGSEILDACGWQVVVTDGHAVLPEGMTHLPDRAFFFRRCLVSVACPRSLVSVGSGAFDRCSRLISIDLPAGLTSIGHGAFHGCTSLVSVAFPRSLASIGVGAFSECSSLVSIAFPATITSISRWAFSRCSSLRSVTFPAGLTSIGDRAFHSCSVLTSVTFPAGLTSIVDDAFLRCYALAHVTFPASLTSIVGYAFYDCPLARVTVPDTATIGPHAFAPATPVLRLPPAKMRWYDAVAFALAYKRCRPLLYGWLERAQTRLGSYGPDGAARQRDREFEGDFAHLALHAD